MADKIDATQKMANDRLDDDWANDGQTILLDHTVTDVEVGIRLDRLAGELFAQFSRATLQKYIKTGELSVNNAIVKPKYAVRSGDELRLSTNLVAHSVDSPEDIALDKVYEDDEMVIINKPAGMVVHPGAGNQTGTLVNALLFHYPNQTHLPRAGLVHRIDKDTTGLLLVAKTAQTQLALIEQLKAKTVYRRYHCVVMGRPQEFVCHRTIDAPIARHPKDRTKMAVRSGGKPAVTHITALTALSDHCCLLDVVLETGRTHQIRVHLSSIGHHLVGDKTYVAPPKKGLGKKERQIIATFARQALHAHTLGFVHPKTGEKMTVSCPMPNDMRLLIDALANKEV